jgi:hypothetical protein
VTRSLTVVFAIVDDFIAGLFRSRAAVIAENLLLGRQLALDLERKTLRHSPSPANRDRTEGETATRVSLVCHAPRKYIDASLGLPSRRTLVRIPARN